MVATVAKWLHEVQRTVVGYGQRKPAPEGCGTAGESPPSTAGVPLTTIAAVLGHADVSTTAIYTTAIGAEHRDLVARVWS